MTEQQAKPHPDIATAADEAAQAAALATAKARAQARVRARDEEKAHRKARHPWFRKKRVTVPSAFILLFAMVMVATGGKDPRNFTLTASGLKSKIESVTKVTTATATVGQSVRDDTLAFRVSSTPRLSETITNRRGTTQTAEGAFVMVRVDITNVGYDPRTLTATDQFLISDTGKRFMTSPAITSVQGARTIFRQKVNPGRTVNGVPLLFDVPAGTRIASIEFHGSPSSPGVNVKLS